MEDFELFEGTMAKQASCAHFGQRADLSDQGRLTRAVLRSQRIVRAFTFVL